MANESYQDRLARLREENEAREQAARGPTWDPALIPEPSTVASSHDPDDIDRLLDRVDILEAYERWCGKMTPDPKGKRESIMISCPRPDHTDEHPSAYANLDKNVYHCGACNEGGDIYTIAGFHFGLDPRTQFRELREAMAIDLGFTITTIGGTPYVELPETEAPPPVLSIVEFLPELVYEKPPNIDWKKLFPNDTFMRRWMTITDEDDLPSEFYVWLGLTAIGMAAGNDVVLADNPNVKTNMFLCLYGRSGIGKTRSVRVLSELLRKALPYNPMDWDSKGTYLIPSPGSAETLVDSFAKTEEDAVTHVKTNHGVRGLVRFDELSTLIGRSSRMGSIIKPTLMEFYDSYEPVTMKSRGAGLVVAEDHFCSTITTTQPGAVRRLLVRDDTDSGFVNRWIFCSGPEKPPVAYRRDQLDIEPCVELLQGVMAWCSTGRELLLAGDALELWETFFTEMDKARKSDTSDLLTRCDLHLKKIIALLCIDEEIEHPTADIVRRALLFWPYLMRSYSLIGAEIGSGPFQDGYDDTVQAIKTLEEKLKTPPKQRDIVRKIGRKHGADIIAKVLKIMEELGEVEVKSIKGPSGRGSAIVTYHYLE